MKDIRLEIERYFEGEIQKCAMNGKYYSEMAKKTEYATEKKHFEDAAWQCGVKEIARLGDMRKDILRIIA